MIILKFVRLQYFVQFRKNKFQARLQILERYTKNLPKCDLDIVEFARKTENFTGADLENLCKQVSIIPNQF